MPKRPLIRKGDRTTHGGTVLAGDTTFLIDGRELARVGDPVSCPQCKGNHVIVTGAPDVLSGQTVARHDDMTDCGAKLIASQHTATWSDGSEATTNAGASPDASESLVALADTHDIDSDEPRAIRFQAVHPETGQPLAKRPYILTREDGSQCGGVTDAQGYTKPIETTAPEQIAVHFMFADAGGRTIDREDLLP